MTEQGWRRFVEHPPHRRGESFLVAERQGEIVAHAYATLDTSPRGPVRHFRIFVGHEWRRAGVASELLRRIALQPPSTSRLASSCEEGWVAGCAFLETRGFRIALEELRQRREGEPPDAWCPPGLTLRESRGREDWAEWIRLNDTCYGQELNFVPASEEWATSHESLPGFHLLIAEAEGSVAGACEIWSAEGRGRLHSVMVDPSFRGRGLSRVLVIAGLRALAGEGLDSVELNVNVNNEAARRTYARLGFVTTSTSRLYEMSRQ